MKAIWKGSISFGLVNIPVMMHSAISEHKFGFRMLCARCHRPLTYYRWCTHCNKEVTWENVVKGLPQKDHSFVVLTKEIIQELKPKTIDVISIKEFVDEKEISNLYIENNYYLSPAKENNKAFFLLAEALKKAQKIAIGQFVMHEKEHLVAVSSYENVLLLTTLHYDYEIRSLETLKIKKVKTTAEELSLALQLIKKLTHKKFNLSKYKDTFVESLKKAIQAAKRGKKVKVVRPKKIVAKKTLRDSLRASLRGEARA